MTLAEEQAPTDVATSDDAGTEERSVALQVLSAEYAVLIAGVSAAWSASLTRTSLFLFSLSASGVALGFAAQTGVNQPPFRLFALAILPLLLFLGVATFVRLVQVQREAIVYITGMNRIRHYFQEAAPSTRPYFVLPAHDDEHALYRSLGTGMYRRPPRNVLYLVAQTQGIVGVVTAAVSAAVAGLAAGFVDATAAWIAAIVAFIAVVVVLFAYWQRSLTELRSAIRPMHPTPPHERGAPF